MAVRIICESAELAVECLRAAQAVEFAAEPEVAEDWMSRVCAEIARGPIGLALLAPPGLDQLAELGQRVRDARSACVLAALSRTVEADRLREVALDLGIVALAEIEPMMSALCLVAAGAESAWTASLRDLNRAERARMQDSSAAASPRKGGRLQRSDGGRLVFTPEAGSPSTIVGYARDVALAMSALHDTDRESERVETIVDGIDSRVVLDVLFGPRRALSDPTSKAALLHYGLPMPTEELCASASRAAAEATRIGFPVRISLTSPDLRVWDHPDLAVDMVDNAARVRDTFRQLMGLARSRLEPAAREDARVFDRLLGVMVTETSDATALLGVRSWPLTPGRVAMDIGFADPHGAASGDRTLAVLPVPQSGIDRALRRLRGSELLFGGSSAQRRARLDAIGDVLLRLSAFVNDRRLETESVELRPVAVLLDGSAEVREACVTVSDAFERSLAAPEAS